MDPSNPIRYADPSGVNVHPFGQDPGNLYGPEPWNTDPFKYIPQWLYNPMGGLVNALGGNKPAGNVENAVGNGPWAPRDLTSIPMYRQMALDQMNAAWSRGQLDGESAQRIRAMIETGPGIPLSSLTDLINTEFRGRMDAQNMLKQSEITGNLQNSINEDILPALNKRIGQYEDLGNRMESMVRNPSLMRTDQDYGNALAQAETAIAGGLSSARRNMASQQTAQGLAGSGKATSLLGFLDMQAANQKAGQQQSMLGDARDRREAYRDQIVQLNLLKPGLQSGELGAMNNALAAYRSMPSYSTYGPGYGTLDDMRAGNLGRGDIEFGKGFNLLNMGMNQAQAMGDKTMSLLSMFAPGQK